MASGDSLRWDWANDPSHYRPLQEIQLEDGRVTQIIIHFENNILLQDVIKYYGEPTDFISGEYQIESGPVTYSARFLYKSKGFMIGTSDMNQKFNITKGTVLVNRVIFFDPEMPLSKLEVGGWIPWRGFANNNP